MPSSFEELKIPAYGEKAPLSTLAQIVVKNATTIQLNVFDETSIPSIQKVLSARHCNMIERYVSIVDC